MMTVKFTVTCVLLCWLGQTVSSDEQTSKCSIDERADTMLSTIEPPARYLGHKAAVASPQECYDVCCSWDRGAEDRCNAALFYPTIGNSQGDADCVLLLCEPFDKCIWTSAQIANTNGSSVARIWRSTVALSADQQPGAEQQPPAPAVTNPEAPVQPSSADVLVGGAPVGVDVAANNGLPESSNQGPILVEMPAEGAAENSEWYGKEYPEDAFNYEAEPLLGNGVAETGDQAPAINPADSANEPAPQDAVPPQGWNSNGNPVPDAGNGQPASYGQQPGAEQPPEAPENQPAKPFWMLFDSYTTAAEQPSVNENPDANVKNDAVAPALVPQPPQLTTSAVRRPTPSTPVPFPGVVWKNAVGQQQEPAVNSNSSFVVQGQAVFVGDGSVDRDAAQLAAAAAEQTAEEDRDFAEQHVDVQVPIFIDGASASETDKVPGEEGAGWVVPGDESDESKQDEEEGSWLTYDGLDLSDMSDDIEYPQNTDEYYVNEHLPPAGDGVPQFPRMQEPQLEPANVEGSHEQPEQKQKPDSESVEQEGDADDNAAWALVVHEIDAKQPVRMTPNPLRPLVNEDSQAEGGRGIDLTSSTALIGLLSILAVGTVLMIFACRRYFAGDRVGGPRYTPLRETKVESQPSASTYLVHSTPVPVYRD